MFDLAWSHILLIAVVALLVIGPKDLPRVLRTAGKWVGRARSIAREFQGTLDQMIREAELEDVRKEVEAAATIDVAGSIENSVDPGGEIKKTFDEPAVETTVPPPEIVADAPAAAPEGSPAPAAPHPAEPAAPTAEPPAPVAEPTTSTAEPETQAAEPRIDAPKSGTHD